MRKLKITELNRISVTEFKQKKKIPLIVVVDNVRSLFNVGSIFRTSDAYLVEAIYLCGLTSTPPHAEIHKSALGAEESVDWQYYENTADAIRQLKENGYAVWSVEQTEGSVMLSDIFIEKNKKYAVVLGNEVKGVQQAVVNLSDGCIELPQFGTKHSLNVSVAGSIVIWEFAKALTLNR